MQRQMGLWWARNFGHNPTDVPANSLLAIGEELGELYRCELKSAQNIRGTPEYWREETRKEIGDVLVTLAVYAYRKGIDLSDAIADRWDVVGKRDWQKDRLTGGCKEHGAKEEAPEHGA
jgi:NTP pyrophosphatase (non-canonical NTP hydrolase)